MASGSRVRTALLATGQYRPSSDSKAVGSNVLVDLRTLASAARATMGKRFRNDAARVQRSWHAPKPGVPRSGFAWVRRKCADEQRKCTDERRKCSDVSQYGGGPGHALRGAT